MNRIITLFIISLIGSFALTGCDLNKTSKASDKEKYFEATVLAVNSNSLLVEPAKGTTERNSADKIEISTLNIDDEDSLLYLSKAAIGDNIRIGYLDDIKESYPAKINEVFHISLIESDQNNQWARIPMVLIDGTLYYDTGKESNRSDRSQVMDGKITSAVDGTQIPSENNQSNFGSEYQYQFDSNNTLEILINDKWLVFEARSGDGSQIKFGDSWYNTGDLSEETLLWLDWYNSLTEQEQLSIDHIPSDLLDLNKLSQSDDKAAIETKQAP